MRSFGLSLQALTEASPPSRAWESPDGGGLPCRVPSHIEGVRAGGETESAAAYVPEQPSFPRVGEAAAGCRGCHLWENATQTVFGEGARAAGVMLVGEQPGDQEDLAGKPFVGPAGRLLDQALEEAGIDRSAAYVTNVVKHFKWRPAGKIRLHQKPNAEEIKACRPWLDAEIDRVRPRIVVCLGA